MSFFRRRKTSTAPWDDPRDVRRAEPGTSENGSSHGGRYLHLPQIDGLGPLRFDMPPAPVRGDVEQRTRQLAESLEGAVDEGSGAAGDRAIESWTASWISSAHTDAIDHAGVIDVHHAQASEWLVEAEAKLAFAEAELERAEQANSEARLRLNGTEERS